LHGAKEITESTMVLIVFGALAYAQIRRAHIRVELVYSHMTPRVQAAMDVVADLAGLIFFGVLIWQCAGEAILSYQIGEEADGLLQFPLYPARWILVTGTMMLILRLMLDLIVDFQRIGSGEALDGAAPMPLIPEMKGLEDETGRQAFAADRGRRAGLRGRDRRAHRLRLGFENGRCGVAVHRRWTS
jgi:TRAP-type C4-dicarboxylate transport system permease small subunit